MGSAMSSAYDDGRPYYYDKIANQQDAPNLTPYRGSAPNADRGEVASYGRTLGASIRTPMAFAPPLKLANQHKQRFCDTIGVRVCCNNADPYEVEAYGNAVYDYERSYKGNPTSYV
jgi:hypothetical protein